MLEKIGRNPLFHLAKTYWRYAAGRRRTLVFYVLLADVAVLVSLTSPLIMGRVMNAIQSLSGEERLAQVEKLLLLWVGVGFLFWSLHGQRRLDHKIVSLPMRWHKDHH